jgi:hypothetical protein
MFYAVECVGCGIFKIPLLDTPEFGVLGLSLGEATSEGTSPFLIG